MKRASFLFLCAVLVAAPRGWAGESSAEQTARARSHFMAAEAHFSLGEFGRALEEYRKAYLIRPLPPLLFNMAQCHRHLGALDKAAFLLRRFLATSPPAGRRAQAEAVLREVETAIKERASQTRPAAPASAPRPQSVPLGPSSSVASSQPATSLSSRPAALGAKMRAAPGRRPVQSPPTLRRPLYKRWWFWTLIGGAVAAGATAAGVLAGRAGERPPGTLAPVDYR